MSDEYILLLHFEGQRTLVVGGASGIGRETALVFAEAGAVVAVADINLKDAKKVAEEVNGRGRRAMAVEVDVVKPESVESMVGEVIAAFDYIDVLVNSAGINIRAPAEDLSEKDWDAVIDVNLKGTFLCCKYLEGR